MSDGKRGSGRQALPPAPSGAPPAGQSGFRWMAPVLVALIGAFMAILDSSIVNVAAYREILSEYALRQAAGESIWKLQAAP